MNRGKRAPSPERPHIISVHGRVKEEVIAHIRDRMRRIRKVISMAHDPEMIEMLSKVVADAEADIKKLEAEGDEA